MYLITEIKSIQMLEIKRVVFATHPLTINIHRNGTCKFPKIVVQIWHVKEMLEEVSRLRGGLNVQI